MGYTYGDVVVTIGENLLKNKEVQKGVKTTLKGAGGLAAIGVGTALETVGTGTVIGTVGSALTGAGCAATQALMTGVATVIPGVAGTAVSGAIGTAATAVFTAASSPLILGGLAVAGVTYGLYKLLE